VRGLLLDLDNTLIPADHEGPLPDEVLAWAQGLKAAGVRLALVTNAWPHRIRRASRALGVPGIGPVGKPLPLGFWLGLKALGIKPEEALVVGDQVFTDLLGARLAGLRVALVEPVAQDPLPHTRWLRRFEHLCKERGTTI